MAGTLLVTKKGYKVLFTILKFYFFVGGGVKVLIEACGFSKYAFDFNSNF